MQNAVKLLDRELHVKEDLLKRFHAYCSRARAHIKKLPQERRTDAEMEAMVVEGRFSHGKTLRVYLDFLRFYLKQGEYISLEGATQLWQDLIENSLCHFDREVGFQWMVACFGPEGDLEEVHQTVLYKERVQKLEPNNLSEAGLALLWIAFTNCNQIHRKLALDKYSAVVQLHTLGLEGLNLIWNVVLQHPEEAVAARAIHHLQTLFNSPSTIATGVPPLALREIVDRISQPYFELKRTLVSWAFGACLRLCGRVTPDTCACRAGKRALPSASVPCCVA